MKASKRKSNLLKRVKDIIDDIYVKTSAEGGYRGKFKDMTSRVRQIAALLRKREILQTSGYRENIIWTWNPVAMEPTDTLYKSIAKEVSKKESEYAKNWRDRQDAKKMLTESIIEESMSDMSRYSDQELWDELKRRGYSIEGNRLVIVKRDYLE